MKSVSATYLHVLTRQPGDPGRLNQPTASPVRFDQARAGAMATCRASKVVWSRHIAKRIPANRRARATVAMREPRRLARRSVHARKPAASARRDRSAAHAAWTNNQRMRGLPALVMWPRRRRSAELFSLGTRPR